jgi:hypothetical protein
MPPLPPAAHTPLGHAPLRCAPRLSRQLSEDGHAVADGAAGRAWCASVREDIVSLHAAGLLQRSLNRVVTSRGGGDDEAGQQAGHLCEKAGINELDIVLNGALARPDALDAAPSLRRWLGNSLTRRAAGEEGGGEEAQREGEGSGRSDESNGGGCGDGESESESGCAALMAAINAAAPWLALTHLVRMFAGTRVHDAPVHTGRARISRL